MARNDGKQPCVHCKERYTARNLSSHEKACAAKKALRERDKQFSAKLKAQKRQEAYAELDARLNGRPPQVQAAPSTQAPLQVHIPEQDHVAANDYLDYPLHEGEIHHLDEEAPVGEDYNQRPPSPVQRQNSEIKRLFHPHSKRPPTFQSFHEYVRLAEQPEPVDPEPWRPFRSQMDFEVAEFCENNMLNHKATETLISLLHRSGSHPEEFTLKNQRELDKLWDLASHKCTAFEPGSVTIRYKNEDKEYTTYTRPLWDWARFLIEDPRLASSFVWDAEKAYKYNGESYIRFYHEPWTADAFWTAQSTLPNDSAAKPVCFVLYADKSKLSSFGTEKGYAVVARLANMPVGIRNTTQFGGGQVVGHQPVVEDDSKEHNKPAFSNFKTVVWHTAFFKLLESLVHPSKVGDWIHCGDGILRWLWPRILILAADYEEACVMALIRGLQGLYPCPICFVPWNEQSDLSTEHPLRTGKESEKLLKEARAKTTVAAQEEILKDHGLRNVENCFWKIQDSDPHAAISYDPLHADDGGFWGDHLFGQIKARVNELGRAAVVKIDTQMAAFPRWSGLNHFDAVMNVSFNEGGKHEDIAKMMLFVAHNVLVDDAGLLLLQVLRSYLEFRTSLSFQVHTSETIAEGSREVLTLDAALKQYMAACEDTEYADKNWNVPKVHSRFHAYTHVKEKGAARNFGTKGGESMHKPMRETYHRMTNFKNVTPQLAKHDHRRTVATFIREQIDMLDEDPDDANFTEDPEDILVLSNVDIGSKLKPVRFLTVEQDKVSDPAFERFRIKFGDFLSDFLPAHGYNLPDGKRIRFDGTDMIEPFRYLKVHYENLSTWSSTKDYLRCNPDFHGHPRYDYVLVNTADKPIFAQLIYLFSCTVEKKTQPFALVLPMDAPVGQVRRKDKILRFRRVKAQARKKTEFISVHSIIRGAVLVPDFDKTGEFLVFDVLDGDMALRLKNLYLGRAEERANRT
ncbi:hypothetical protein C8R43DRAFT_1028329 [Mycena crocata]|nr:hypothetical protein C8R43DRAFT_1028329 [Mycena crocata]